jgi:hypothetical protein
MYAGVAADTAGVTSAVFLIVVATSVWVGFDARSRDWSGNAFADRPWKWVAGSLLLWIVIFPMYLAKRGQAVPAAGVAVPHQAIAQEAVAGWTAEEIAAATGSPRASRRSSSFRLEGDRSVGRWIWVVLLVVALAFLWTRGSFDHWLYHFHLNYNACGTNGFGATFCRNELNQYEQRLRDAGITP